MSSYESYIRSEWDLFFKDDTRWLASLRETQGADLARVLDVGCGAGQQLIPFAVERQSFGVGVDIAEECGRAGGELVSKFFPVARIRFARADAANLPFQSGIFDLVLCRIALPYMNNDEALKEMARVLRPGGTLILKIHHWRFYLSDIAQSVKHLNPLQGIHALRVLAVGIAYHLTGYQMSNRISGSETYQTLWLLNKKLREFGLSIMGETADSQSSTPAFLIRKLSQ